MYSVLYFFISLYGCQELWCLFFLDPRKILKKKKKNTWHLIGSLQCVVANTDTEFQKADLQNNTQ